MPRACSSGGESRLRTALIAARFLLLIFWVNFSAFGQQQQPTSYAGFEGRKVETVDVSATPLMDVTSFRAMIRQKAAKPFSQAALRESITALQNTKLFSSVKLNVTTQKGGLKLVFVLEPAYYVGYLSFPGAISASPYTRLLQAANIPAQSAFTNDVPPQGQKALQLFLQTNGYFLASVQSKSDWDQQHMIVNLAFACDLKKLARIGEIEIDGVPPAEADKLRGAMDSLWAKLKRSSLKSGQKYSIHRIYQGVAHIRAELADQGRLAPTVRFDGGYALDVAFGSPSRPLANPFGTASKIMSSRCRSGAVFNDVVGRPQKHSQFVSPSDLPTRLRGSVLLSSRLDGGGNVILP